VNIDTTTCMLDILDTAGQEEFSALADQYMRQGQAFLCVYSIIDRNSFDEILRFVQQVYQAKQLNPDTAKLPMICLGNKSDLEPQRTVQTSEGQQLARSLGIQFMETSAKTRTNVEESFFAVVRQIRETMPSKSNLPWEQQQQKKKITCVLL